MRVETIGDCTLILGDSLEIMPTLGKVDCVVTDPPYGVGVEYGFYDDTREELERLLCASIPLMRSVADCVAFTAGIKNFDLIPRPDWIGAWIVPAGMMASPFGFGCWQPIVLYGKDPYLANRLGSRPDIIIDGSKSEKTAHPCPKPIKAWSKIVTRFSLAGQLILDPFMGSGTTGVACVELGRRFVGIEIDEKYFDIACERISRAERQGDLFRKPVAVQESLLT